MTWYRSRTIDVEVPSRKRSAVPTNRSVTVV
jgi:hypothetical protein